MLCKADVWIVVDSQGDYAVGASEDDAKEAYENCIQALQDSGGYRVVHLPVSIPIPELQELPEVEIAAVGPAKVS